MKKIIFIAIISILATACNHDKLDKAAQQNDSLVSVVDQRDTSLYNFIMAFNEIESNLDSIAAKQHIIAINSSNPNGEFRGGQKAKIKLEIAAINELMEKNRKDLQDLENKLKGSKHNNAILQKTIKTLNIQISQKDYELCELKLTLDALNLKVGKLLTTVDSLSVQNYIKSVVIDYQANDLYTAYYIVGQAKDLIDRKIINREGGLLGLGKTTKLSQDFNTEAFTQIDFTKIKTIPVDGDDIKIITNHPTESYLIKDDKAKKGRVISIVIINPVLFWSSSKYLVITKK